MQTKFIHLYLGDKTSNQEVPLDLNYDNNNVVEMIRNSGESSSEDELNVL